MEKATDTQKRTAYIQPCLPFIHITNGLRIREKEEATILSTSTRAKQPALNTHVFKKEVHLSERCA